MSKRVYPRNLFHAILMTLLIAAISAPFYLFLMDKIPLPAIDFIAYSLSFLSLHLISKNNLLDYKFKRTSVKLSGVLVLFSFSTFLIVGIPTYRLLMHHVPASKPLDLSLNILLSLILIAPVFEEFLMRGILLRGLMQKYSYRLAIIITAFLFMVVHFDYAKSLGLLVDGLILGYAYYRTQNLLIVILMHACYNLASICHSYLFPISTAQWSSPYGDFTFGTLTISGICWILCLVYLIRNHNKEQILTPHSQ